jgi:tetratricopeptide (TPR) repeat protein
MRMLERLWSTGTGGLRWIDHAVIGGLILILAFAPLAFGAVHQWAYTLLETIQYALLILWMARIWLEGSTPARIAIPRSDLASFALPSALFALLLVFQVTPLPPAMMRVISPATYRLYRESLPEWPRSAPYAALRAAWSAKSHGSTPHLEMALPPVGGQKQVRAQAASPNAAAKTAANLPHPPAPESLGKLGDLRWRSIAIAPSVTWAGLIELLACAGVFFLVLGYPLGFVGAERESNTRFVAVMVVALLAVGVFVALIGLVEKATWNGRILWFYVPRDWGGPLAVNIRASGPFVNPDHFANFLATILPLAAVGSLFPITLTHRDRRTDLRLPCAVAAFLIGAGIVLSLSRGAWIASLAGVCIALALSFGYARERAPAQLRRLSARAIPFALAGLVSFLVILLFLIGPSGRSAATSRIGATIAHGDSLGLKPDAWRDTLKMIRDFPVFGVGLGCWPELFPHYQHAPWSDFYFRQPENDYLQLAAETGLAGIALTLWFGAVVWRKGRAAAARLSVRRWPLFAALGAGIVASLIHELFDFSLHTPANALLFTIVLAMFLRVALTPSEGRTPIGLRSVSAPSKYTLVGAALIAGVAAIMIVGAQTQRDTAYPYDIGTPQTLAQAESATVNHPADSGVHLALAALMPPGAPPPLRQQQLLAAVWLNPNDPLARDLYARSLFLAGKKREGLSQVRLSVFHAPDLESHFYLQPRALPWLLPDEQHAIYEGFGQAIAAGYAGSANGLAQFYRDLGRHREAAEVSAAAAADATNNSEKVQYLLSAGRDYAKAMLPDEAQKNLQAAIALDPADARPYTALMVGVLGPAHDLDGIRDAMKEGLRNGAKPLAMEQALADASREAGDLKTAEAALKQVANYAPTFASVMKLGDFYNETAQYERATIAYQRAADIDPRSARAYFRLAQAEESDFDFAGARRDYAKAVELEPGDKAMRKAYLDFQQRAARALKQSPAQ